MLRKPILALAAALLSVAAANAQTTLRYQFKEGDKLPYTMEQKMKMTMNINNMDIETKMNMSMEMSINVLSVGKDGGAKVQIKMAAAKMSMEGPTGNFTVDSKDKGEPDNEIAKILSGVIKAIATMEMTGNMLTTGEMKDVNVSEETLKAMKNLPGADKLGDFMSPDSFKNLVSNLVFPADAVAKGKTWNHKSEAKSPFGKAITENTYTYEGPVEQDKMTLEKIAVKPDTKIEANPNADIKITIKSNKGSGHILFDNKSGRIYETVTQQTTEMQIAAGGLELGQVIEQTTTFRLKK
jgi:hypothetical protein